MSTSAFPFPPRLRLRIGISGHRVPPKLPKEADAPLRATLDRILATVVDAAQGVANDYLACAPARRFWHRRVAAVADPSAAARRAESFAIVSSLAEGSDRLVAEAGLAAGFRLEAVLPLDRNEYARDFESPESRAKFEQLLAGASAVFEVGGDADERPRAYEAAGYVMLANIDLLVVIWDGADAAGIGGTAQIVSRAIADGIPIVWLDPAQPSVFQLSRTGADDATSAAGSARPKEMFRPADETAIAGAVNEILALPTHAEARQSLHLYLSERQRRWNFCPWYPALLWLFAGRRLRRTDFRLTPPLPDTTAQWKFYLETIPADRAQRPAIDNVLLPACSAADHLAVYYSLVYRSTYVFNFFLAALAVALALCGLFVHDPDKKSYLVFAELLSICTILLAWLRGYGRQWHRRWLDYRRLAEDLRQMRMQAAVGAEGPMDRPGRYLDVDAQDWVEWYTWSLRRLLPLPDRSADPAYLAAVREALRKGEIAEQVRYHTANEQRIGKLDRRMRRTGEIFLAVTAGACLLFLCLVWLHRLPQSQPDRDLVLAAFTFVTALLPTLGAALSAIYVQGDFKTVAEQSRRTAKRLAAIDRLLAEEPLSLGRLTDRIEQTSDILMADLTEWQTVFRTRPLSLPT